MQIEHTTLIVGLGNPGPLYAKNRHNVGFMLIDMIADAMVSDAGGTTSFKEKFCGEIAAIKSDGTNASEVLGEIPEGMYVPGAVRVFLFKPKTYMNLSGQAIQQVMRFYKIPSSQMIVVHDDLDIRLGEMRVKRGGGDGGHNGLKSVDTCVGRDYTRIRIGIGRPDEKEQIPNYVLGDFEYDEAGIVEQLCKKIVHNMHLLLSGNQPTFVNSCRLG